MFTLPDARRPFSVYGSPAAISQIFWGYIGIMEKKMETTIVYWGYIRIMEHKLETTIVYRGYIGIMEKKMETTIVY